MLRQAIAVLLLVSCAFPASGQQRRLDLKRLLSRPEALNSLVIAYTSYENSCSLYVFGNGKAIIQPTVATVELVQTCKADLTEDRLRALVQLFIDKHFFDLPERDFMMLDASEDDWAQVQLQTIRLTDDEGTASRTFGTGTYNGVKETMPSNFADIRTALIQLRDSAFPKGPTNSCPFETQIKK